MEDREFELEQNKFTFEKAKHIDDMRFPTVSALYRQLFAFNIGILTLIFFVIYQSLEYSIPKFLYFCLIISISLSTSSMHIVMKKTPMIASENVELLSRELLNGENTKDEYQRNRKLYIKNGIWSYYFCLVSWIIVLIVIFVAIFTVDFKKEKEVFNIGTIYCNMADTLKDTFQGLDTKSFAQQTQKHPQFVEYSEAGQSFAQTAQTIAEMQVKNMASPKPQKPQPESTIKQPSNTQ